MHQKIFTQELEGTRRRGRPGIGWKEEVERDRQGLGVRRWRELVADRQKWKDIVRQAKAHSALQCQCKKKKKEEEEEEDNNLIPYYLIENCIRSKLTIIGCTTCLPPRRRSNSEINLNSCMSKMLPVFMPIIFLVAWFGTEKLKFLGLGLVQTGHIRVCFSHLLITSDNTGTRERRKADR